MDKFSKEKRSEIMSKIGSENTKPEVVVRKILHYQGYRFRLHRHDLPGKPDIVLPKYKTVIFVHGCFWHRHNCLKGNSKPKTNVVFWNDKIAKNQKRDSNNEKLLKNLGWKVLIIWECETKCLTDLQKIILKKLPKNKIIAS